MLITDWHVFEPQAMTPGRMSAKVARARVAMRTQETAESLRALAVPVLVVCGAPVPR